MKTETLKTETLTISLLDFNNRPDAEAVTYLWFAGVVCPAGQDFTSDTDSESEDYCDLNELIGEMGLWDLEGTVSESGQWSWDGQGNPTDLRGNTIYNLIAR